MATTTSFFLRHRRPHTVGRDVDRVTPAREARTVPTFFGWTPGLRSLVAGRVLTCGCLVGVYQTRAGEILEVLDACGSACPHAGHRQNAILDDGDLALVE